MDLYLLAITIGSYLKLFRYLKEKLHRELNIRISPKNQVKNSTTKILANSPWLSWFEMLQWLSHSPPFLEFVHSKEASSRLIHEQLGMKNEVIFFFFFGLIPHWKEFSKWLNLESLFNSYKTLWLCPHVTVHLLSCFSPESFASVSLSKS